MKIYIGADHRGFKLKELLVRWLFDNGYEVFDAGAQSFDPSDDYTKYASEVASLVSDTNDQGILLCGSGVGVDVVANKFDGVRAAIGKTPEQVKSGRTDDNMNILVIAADYTGEKEAVEMVEAFLKTDFDDKERHKRRLSEIEKIEANN